MGEFSFLNIVACPVCKSGLESMANRLHCSSCSIDFDSDQDHFYKMIDPELYTGEEKSFIDDMEGFWGEGWEMRSKSSEHSHLVKSQEQLKHYFDVGYKNDEIVKLNDRFPYYSSGLFSNEVNFSELNNKIVLNIGCGFGTESAKLSYWGKSFCIPLDITRYAAKFSQDVIRKLDCLSDYAVQADARHLPFKSNSIDYIYSSGVLHHSPNIQQSFSEIHRVLKPGGKAYIGLYGKSSMQFITIVLKGILKGNWTKKSLKRFINKNTEEAWETGSGNLNPRTDLFSKSECLKLSKDFSEVKIRTNGLIYLHIPKIGKYLEKLRPSFMPPGLPIGGNNYLTLTK